MYMSMFNFRDSMPSLFIMKNNIKFCPGKDLIKILFMFCWMFSRIIKSPSALKNKPAFFITREESFEGLECFGINIEERGI